MLVELKKLLREMGVRRLHTEDWSDDETAFRPTVTKPFPDFAELFSLPEKLAILRRAWRRWGWRGVKTAIQREAEVHRLLTRERILALDLVIGRKLGEAEAEPAEDAAAKAEEKPAEATGEEPPKLRFFHMTRFNIAGKVVRKDAPSGPSMRITSGMFHVLFPGWPHRCLCLYPSHKGSVSSSRNWSGSSGGLRCCLSTQPTLIRATRTST
jgi:hypothetical protein